MEPSALQITSAIRDEIIRHAREGKPEEICGLLRGRNHRAIEVIRAQNTAEDKIDNYDVDPQTLLRQFEFEEMGDRMLAIYHSHPVSEAFPSATDAWNANYPDTYYLICSLENEETPVLRAFHLLPDFDDLDLVALRQELPFYETRPGLFGYFVPNERQRPDALSDLTYIDPPFYVVFTADANGQITDHRVVEVREHPVVLVRDEEM
jgi:proteasome lid subunit RPN8/RPN11